MSDPETGREFMRERIQQMLKEERLKGGGGGGTSDGMEARVKTLEAGLIRIDSKLDGITRDVAEIKGRIANMPSTWQMIGITAAMLALVIAGSGGMIALIRFIGEAPKP